MSRGEKSLTAFVVALGVACMMLAFLVTPRHEPDPGAPTVAEVPVPVTVPAPDSNVREAL